MKLITTSGGFSQIFVLVFILILFVIGGVAVLLRPENSKLTSPKPNNNVSISLAPTRVPTAPLGMYVSPKIPKRDVYIIFMVGDSMTEQLGPHGGKLNEFINTLYKSTPGNQRVVIDNYAKGSTNILGLQDVMKNKLVVGDAVLDPLLSRRFDLILIESFGYNPLSHLGIEGGLKKQTETLELLTKTLIKSHPEAVIVFVATVAPHKETYGLQSMPGKTTAERIAHAEERMAYIKNHIEFAKAHNIPLIDIYSKTLTTDGNGDLSYINLDDHIHASFKGRDFISQEIANFIYENEIFPK